MSENRGFKIAFWGGLGLCVYTMAFMEKPWFWPVGFRETLHIPQGFALGAAIIVLTGLAYFMEKGMRADTNHIFTQGRRFFWNENDGVHDAGFWQVRRLGGLNAMGMNISGKSNCLVSAAISTYPVGRDTFAEAAPEATPLRDLPPVVRDLIENEGLPTGTTKNGEAYVFWANKPLALERVGRDEVTKERDYHLHNRIQNHHSDMAKSALEISTSLASTASAGAHALNPYGGVLGRVRRRIGIGPRRREEEATVGSHSDEG